MAGKATIEIVGRLARDPEMRFTAQGKAVCTFSIPVQERKDDETVWYKVTAWEKQAEVINQYAAKGTWIVVRGVPKIETWDDKATGEKRAQFAITLREFTFCGGERAGSDDSADETPAPKVTPKAAPATPRRNAPVAVDDDALPF